MNRIYNQDVNWYDEAAVTNIAAEASDYLAWMELRTAGAVDQFQTRGSGLDAGSEELDLWLRNLESNPLEEFARPAREYRYQRTRGADHESATRSAVERAQNQTEIDLKLAETHRYRQNFRASGVTTYLRVPRPELSESGVCGLCIAASTRVYKTEDLLPIHGGCNCLTVPAGGGDEEYARQEREKLYRELGATRKEELLRYRVRVDEHGQYGPILVPASHRTQTPREADPIRREYLQQQLVVLEERLSQNRFRTERAKKWTQTRVRTIREQTGSQ